MIPLSEAQRFVLESVPVLPARPTPFVEMLGRVLATDVVATETVPPFDNTAVDGFAVRSADVTSVPAELRVVATIAAGAVFATPLQRGEAVRIMTGAPIPSGADAVVMVEDSEMLDETTVRLMRAAEPGAGVRPAGSDVTAGSVVFRAGEALTAAGVGVLAAINAREVLAHPVPRVALLSTGDELVVDGSPLRPGQIRESNLTMLGRLLRAHGFVVDDLGVVRDDEDVLAAVLAGAAESHDAIVTSGGVSMGDFDVVKAVLGRIAEMRWMQLAIKPAKPFAFGTMRAGARVVPVFGLPGNPVSSLISYELLARPALRQMAGHTEHRFRPVVRAVVDRAIVRRVDGKEHFVRVHASFGADGRLHAADTGPQGSHQLAATAAANGLARVPDGTGVPAGGEVDVVLLD